MQDDEATYSDITFQTWEAAFRPGMGDFASTRFIYTREGDGRIRIAFGSDGPFVDAMGNRSPVFHCAVTISDDLAVTLAERLLEFVARPKQADD